MFEGLTNVNLDRESSAVINFMQGISSVRYKLPKELSSTYQDFTAMIIIKYLILFVLILPLAYCVKTPVSENDVKTLDGYIYLYESSGNSQNLDTSNIVYGYLHNFQSEGIVKIEDGSSNYYITVNPEIGFFHYYPEDSILTLIFESEARIIDYGILNEKIQSIKDLNIFLFSKVNTNFCMNDSGFCVDWGIRKILAAGIGVISPLAQNPGMALAIAKRAAKIDALRNAFEGCKAFWVNDSTKLAQLMEQDSLIDDNITSFIKSYPISPDNYTSSDSLVYLNFEINIMGINGLSTHVRKPSQ